MQRSDIIIGVCAAFLTLLVIGGIFFIPFRFVTPTAADDSDALPDRMFFTLERYAAAEVPAVKAQLRQSAAKKQIRQKHSEQIKAPMSPPTILAEEAAEKPAETDLQTVAAAESQNMSAVQHSAQKTGSPAKSKNKTVIYQPDWRVDKLPAYPTSARRLGQQGRVGITVYINDAGKILNVLATSSSGYASLDNAAINAVKSWSFAGLHLTDKLNIVKTEIDFRLE